MNLTEYYSIMSSDRLVSTLYNTQKQSFIHTCEVKNQKKDSEGLVIRCGMSQY